MTLEVGKLAMRCSDMFSFQKWSHLLCVRSNINKAWVCYKQSLAKRFNAKILMHSGYKFILTKVYTFVLICCDTVFCMIEHYKIQYNFCSLKAGVTNIKQESCVFYPLYYIIAELNIPSSLSSSFTCSWSSVGLCLSLELLWWSLSSSSNKQSHFTDCCPVLSPHLWLSLLSSLLYSAVSFGNLSLW